MLNRKQLSVRLRGTETPTPLYQRLAAMTRAERITFSVWVLASAESNAIEGEYETAETLRWLSEAVRQFPVVPTRSVGRSLARSDTE